MLLVIAVILAVLLLFPVPIRMKDGGSVEYKATLYSVTDVHRASGDPHSDKEFLEGIIIEVFGVEIYNNVQ